MRGIDKIVSVTTDIAPAHVINENEDDIGLRGMRDSGLKEKAANEETENSERN